MNSVFILRQSIAIGFFSLLSLLKLSAQENLTDLLKMSRPQLDKINYRNILTAHLQTCAKSENTREAGFSQACQVIGTFDKELQTLAEVYFTLLEGDKSIKDAGLNKFKKTQAKEKLNTRTGEAKEALKKMSTDFTQVVNYTFRGSQYDFDKEILEFGIGASIGLLSGRTITIELTDGQSEGLLKAPIKLPMSKAEKLFDNDKGRFDALIIIKYGDLFENKNSGVLAGKVKTFQVYLKDTGDLLWEKTY